MAVSETTFEAPESEVEYFVRAYASGDEVTIRGGAKVTITSVVPCCEDPGRKTWTVTARFAKLVTLR